MLTVEEFCREAMREQIAPGPGSVKERIRYAARRLGWAYSRTRDAWYADPRISISGEELAAIEELTGVRYARQEADRHDAAIHDAIITLAQAEADSPGSLIAAVFKTACLLHRAGNPCGRNEEA